MGLLDQSHITTLGMCDLSELPKIGNLKLGIRVNVSTIRQALKSPHFNVRHYANFSVLRDKYVYIIFWSGNYVNITKIPTVRHVKASIKHFVSLFKGSDIEIRKEHIKIHNISASGKFIQKCNLKKLHHHFKNNTDLIRAKINLVFFPALFLKYKSGTCTVFQNGKYTVVGCKSYTSIINIANSVCVYMKTL